jgi:hypothetical protein
VKLVIGAADIQMVLAASMGLAGLISLSRRGRPRAAPGSDAHRLATALLAAVALASAANYFLLGRHPSQFVKAWDVQHVWFGSKYAAELGYFRIYECTLAFDAQQRGAYREVRELSDLRTPQGRMPSSAVASSSDCAARFSPERRAEFLRDLDFFQSLPEQPQASAWFVDNGYNQSPFFTALTAPLFQRAPSYRLLLALSLVDVALELLPFLLLARAFGLRAALLAATYFFTSFSNQFALMGGSILRFAYLALLLVAAAQARRARPRAAGVALGLATLFQVFPALYALGLGVAAGYRALRERRLPDWALPFGLAYAAGLVAGFLLSLAVVSLETWREFAAKLALHGEMLSEYRVGLKLPFVLDWPIPPGGWLPYAQKVAELHERHGLYLTCAAALLIGALSLAPKLRSLELAILFASMALYVATPVHYYFATLVLLFFVSSDETRQEAAGVLGRSLLFLLSAGAFLVHRSTGSLPLVNNYWLSLGLLGVLVVWMLALHRDRRPLEAERLEHEDFRARGSSHQHVDARVAASRQLEGGAALAAAPLLGTAARDQHPRLRAAPDRAHRPAARRER